MEVKKIKMRSSLLFYVIFVCSCYAQKSTTITIDSIIPNDNIIGILNESICKSKRCFTDNLNPKVITIDMGCQNDTISILVSINTCLFINEEDFISSEVTYFSGFNFDNHLVLINSNTDEKLIKKYFEMGKSKIQKEIKFGFNVFSDQKFFLSHDKFIHLEDFCYYDIFTDE